MLTQNQLNLEPVVREGRLTYLNLAITQNSKKISKRLFPFFFHNSCVDRLNFNPGLTLNHLRTSSPWLFGVVIITKIQPQYKPRKNPGLTLSSRICFQDRKTTTLRVKLKECEHSSTQTSFISHEWIIYLSIACIGLYYKNNMIA